MILGNRKPPLVKIRWVQEDLPLLLQASLPHLFWVLQGKFKYGFWSADIGIRQCAASWHHVYAKMCQFTGIGYLTKGIEFFNDCIEHDNKMLVCIKVLYIVFSFLFTTELEHFMLDKPTNQLTIHRLSVITCTFVHCY